MLVGYIDRIVKIVQSNNKMCASLLFYNLECVLHRKSKLSIVLLYYLPRKWNVFHHSCTRRQKGANNRMGAWIQRHRRSNREVHASPAQWSRAVKHTRHLVESSWWRHGVCEAESTVYVRNNRRRGRIGFGIVFFVIVEHLFTRFQTGINATFSRIVRISQNMHVGLCWMIVSRTNSQTMLKTMPSLMRLPMPRSLQIFCRVFSLPLASPSSLCILSQALSTFWVYSVIKYNNNSGVNTLDRSEWIYRKARKSTTTANPALKTFKSHYHSMLRWSSTCILFSFYSVINLDSHWFKQKLRYYQHSPNMEIQPCTCLWSLIFFSYCCFTYHPVSFTIWPKSLWILCLFPSLSGA